MNNFFLHTNASQTASGPRFRQAPSAWLYEETVRKRMYSAFALSILSLVAAGLGVAAGLFSLQMMAIVAVGIAGLPIFLSCIFNLQFGLIMLMLLQFFILSLAKLYPGIPYGLSFDIVTVALLFGLFLKFVNTNETLPLARNPLAFLLLLWIGYATLQVLNPNAASRLAWLYTVRSYALIMLVYFVFLYAVDSVRFLWVILAFWMGIALLAALYGLQQHYFGLRGFEFNWLMARPDRFARHNVWGMIRKWSFLPGAMVYGLLMSLSGLTAFFLSRIVEKRWQRWLLLVLSAIMIWGMFPAGMRSAYFVLSISLTFYTIMKLDKRTIMIGLALLVAGLFLVFTPTQNSSIRAFQTAFLLQEDASFNVRESNWDMVQPQVRANPIGVGMGSTGVWGQRFSPHTFWADFPPDSGYVRVAVEMGWIGLIILMLILATAMKVGIASYFRIKNIQLKEIYLVLLSVLIGFIALNYPQEAVTTPPFVFLFLFILAMIHVIPHLDRQLQKEAAVPS